MEGNLPVKIWAHRGCCCRHPENTLEAFRAACALEGLEGIELDIQLTKDGEIAVIHDETVDRTTEGYGNVRDFTLAGLKKLRIKGRKSFGFRLHSKERIPAMREVLDLVKPYCLKYGLKINIELKNSVVRYEGMEEKILALVREYGLNDHIVYSSFNPDSIVLLKELDPSVKAGILHPSLRECLSFADAHEADALHCSYGGLDAELPAEREGMPVRMWNFPPAVPFFPAEGSFAIPAFDWIASRGVTDVFSNAPELFLLRRGAEKAASGKAGKAASGRADPDAGDSGGRLHLELNTCISAGTGLFRRGAGTRNYMADPHFFAVSPGDSFEFRAKGYQYQLAVYRGDADPELMHGYKYPEDGNWVPYTGSIRRLHWKCRGRTFTERCLVRAVVRRCRPGPLAAQDRAFVESSCRFIRKSPAGAAGMPAPGRAEPKSVFIPEIEDTARKVNSLRKDGVLVLGLLADSHYAAGSGWEDTAGNLLAVHAKSPFDALVHLGDFTDGTLPLNLTKEYFEIQKKDMEALGVPLYFCLGNHDANYFRGNPEPLGKRAQARLYLGRDEPHYYIDYADRGLRLLFLDSFDHTQEGQENRYGFSPDELAWVKETLASIPDGMRVLVFSHAPLLASMHFWSKAIRGEEEMVRLLEDFDRSGGFASGGRVLAYVHGHVHAGQVNTELSFPVVAVGCAKIEDDQVHKAPGSVTCPREPGTVSQELWDVLAVDAHAGRLDFVRFGAGEDRHIDRGMRWTEGMK